MLGPMIPTKVDPQWPFELKFKYVSLVVVLSVAWFFRLLFAIILIPIKLEVD